MDAQDPPSSAYSLFGNQAVDRTVEDLGVENTRLLHHQESSSLHPLQSVPTSGPALETVETGLTNRITLERDRDFIEFSPSRLLAELPNAYYRGLNIPSGNRSYAFDFQPELQIPPLILDAGEEGPVAPQSLDQIFANTQRSSADDPLTSRDAIDFGNIFGWYDDENRSRLSSPTLDSFDRFERFELPWLNDPLTRPLSILTFSGSHVPHTATVGTHSIRHYGSVASEYIPSDPYSFDLTSSASLPLLSNRTRADAEHAIFPPSQTTAWSYPASKTTCVECSREFTRPSERRKHELCHVEVGKRPFQCGECDAGFIYKKDLERHSRSKHAGRRGKQSRYYCPIPPCAFSVKGFVRKDKYLQHMKRLHPASKLTSDGIIPSEATTTTATSDQTNHSLSTIRNPTSQRARSSSVDSIASLVSQSTHEATTGSGGPSRSSAISVNHSSNSPCPHSKGKATKSSELGKHMQKHKRPYLCDVKRCRRREEGFTTIHDLRRHKRSVHNIPTYTSLDKSYLCPSESCPTAGKRWPRLDNLRQHVVKMHSREDPEDLIRRSESNAVDVFTDPSTRANSSIIFSSYHPPIERSKAEEEKRLIY